MTLPACGLVEIAADPIRHGFKFPARKEVEPLREESGLVAAALVRRQELLVGCVEVTPSPAARVGAETAGRRAAGQSLFRVRVRISNLTEFGATDDADEVLMRSLAFTHTLLGVREGEFVSLLDPADPFKHAAASCRNVGTFPVLAGEEGRHDTLLFSPIILYDYPQVAAESAGQFFDGTEIDENAGAAHPDHDRRRKARNGSIGREDAAASATDRGASAGAHDEAARSVARTPWH